MITDFTKEHPDRTLWRFWIPMMFSVMFQQIYNIADSMIAGKFAGEDALAAVGASYPITIIFMAFAVGMNLGASVVVSRLFGAGDRKGVKRAVTTAFVSSLGLAAVLTVFGYFFSSNMMEWIHTPQNIMADGILYLKIYVFGMIFLMLYNVCTGVFTALGDSKTPLYFLLGSSAGNIILDLIFVAQFHWGVAGVAWATFIAQESQQCLHWSLCFPDSDLLQEKKSSHFLTEDILPRFCNCSTKYFTAECTKCRKSFCTGYCQSLWLGSCCRIFRCD